MGISAKATLVVVLALVLPAPAQALVAEIREQPADTVRTEVVHFEWLGAAEEAPEVAVEHKRGLDWATAAQMGADDLLVEHEGKGVWSAHWQPARHSPSGRYRIRVDGTDFALVSDDFVVRPCRCVLPNRMRSRWRNGRFRLRITAEYLPAATGDFYLPPEPVRTGRALVRVLRDGRRVDRVRLRYARGAFRGKWRGRRGPRYSVVFQLVSLRDRWGNR